ncbi:MAG: hypothetical protein RR280_08565 [Bacteroidaceae bacterium]
MNYSEMMDKRNTQEATGATVVSGKRPTPEETKPLYGANALEAASLRSVSSSLLGLSSSEMDEVREQTRQQIARIKAAKKA